MLKRIIAPTTTAMVNFVTRTVGWKIDGRYNALSYEVNKLWHRGRRRQRGLGDAAARRRWPTTRSCSVLIAHGWNDLSCPFMASVLIVDQMPAMGNPARVQVKEYPGGHMFYTRPASQAALRKDVMRVYAAH